MNKMDTNHTGSTTNSEMLEKALSSIGALAAISTVRRSFPDAGCFERRYDQHHDNDMDIPEKYRKLIS